jgi:pimeloyl-ACP methyl ester carboxylesterase
MHLPGAVVVLAGALLAACGTTPAPPAAPPSASLLKPAPCKLPAAAGAAHCGVLTVPEDWSRTGGRELTLRIAVLPATGPRALPPLYHFEGGPGLPASIAAEFYATVGAAYRRNRDVVLMDQRGTGGSAPLACPVFVTHPLVPVLDTATVAACRVKLAATADLARYGTADAVRDVEQLRLALGHEQIDLIGLSYGTRVAQEYARAQPQRVRAMALLGALSPEDRLPATFGPNAAAVLGALTQRCRQDRACRAAIPDLARDLSLLRGRLAGGPIDVTLPDGRPAQLTPGPFWEAVRAQLVTATQQRRLPWLLHDAAQGRYEPLLAAIVPREEPGANGALLSVSCGEDTLHLTEAEIAASADTVFGRYRVDQQLAACRAWAVPPAPRPAFATGDWPVLLMSGGMDAVTPPAGAQAIARHLKNARVVVVPELGHFPDGLAHMECYDELIVRFFETGDAAGLDRGCIRDMRPPPFDLPP